MELNFELARILVAFAATAVAAWQDQKTSFIDEKIVYSMIATGIVLNLATFDLQFIIYSLGIAAIVFAIGYFSYKTGQLGGGDVLLFVGIHLLLPVYPTTFSSTASNNASFLLSLVSWPFVLSVFLASSFFALVGSSLFYARQLLKKKLKPNLVLLGLMALVSLVFLSLMLSFSKAGPAQVLFYLLILVPGTFFYGFRQQIVDEVITKRIRIKEIEDEDVLLVDKMPQQMVKKYSLGKVLTKKEVEKLKLIEKKHGIHSFPVAKVLPRFGPYILLALVVCLLVKDFFLWVLFS